MFANGSAEVTGEAKPAKKQYLTMAAVASSSGLFPYIVSIGKVINEYVPEFSITVSESGGNVDNTKRLRAGEIKILYSCKCQRFWEHTCCLFRVYVSTNHP